MQFYRDVKLTRNSSVSTATENKKFDRSIGMEIVDCDTSSLDNKYFLCPQTKSACFSIFIHRQGPIDGRRKPITMIFEKVMLCFSF